MSANLEIDSVRRQFLSSDHHGLVLGGPGSGKTTMSLLKASREIEGGTLKRGQRVLFLSFARATIARVTEHSRAILAAEQRESLEISTYHAFAWALLKSHGYLLNGYRRIEIVSPHEAAAHLSESSEEERRAETHRLFDQEGRITFDLFSEKAAELLGRCNTLRKALCDRFPIVFLDEFQDTDSNEWELIKLLGIESRLVALADAEQRIYGFRGADPARIGDFIRTYAPVQFDFGSSNHRSTGTDILLFGNALLAGRVGTTTFKDVSIVRYPIYHQRSICYALKTRLLGEVRRLRQSGTDWSLAILVPSKRLMVEVSDYLSEDKDSLPTIAHELLIDQEGPALSALAIASLLQSSISADSLTRTLLANVVAHCRGRRGNDGPTKANASIARGISEYLRTGTNRGTARQRIIDASHRIARLRQAWLLSGSVELDWETIRAFLKAEASVPQFSDLYEDSKYIRLLRKGGTLRRRLDEMWRDYGSYPEALKATEDAIQKEQLAVVRVKNSGIHLMTIHKSKGKEFDSVLIFEGYNYGRFLRNDAGTSDNEESRLALRVAVTRARSKVLVFTPASHISPLLV